MPATLAPVEMQRLDLTGLQQPPARFKPVSFQPGYMVDPGVAIAIDLVVARLIQHHQAVSVMRGRLPPVVGIVRNRADGNARQSRQTPGQQIVSVKISGGRLRTGREHPSAPQPQAIDQRLIALIPRPVDRMAVEQHLRLGEQRMPAPNIWPIGQQRVDVAANSVE